MCGLAGMLTGRPDSCVGVAVETMTDALVHRGPDGFGFWRLAGDQAGLCARDELRAPADVVLGHRRLSIVDLEAGDQPMLNDDGTVCVVYNGEIYNHPELRRELEQRGHRYRTACDTETLVHGWEEWGEDLFGRLNGIFAVAIADLQKREVVVARDPIGVKPLYVGATGGKTWFASELVAADRARLLSERLDPDSLKLLLTFRFTPSPHTIHADAWKLPPGHYARLRCADAGRRPTFVAYSSRIRSSLDPRGMTEWGEALMSELGAAVTRQLMADVPLASLLSGGIDSSLVTQMMAASLPYAPETFAIGMRSDGDANETVAAQQAARELGVPETSTLMDDHDYVAAWPSVVRELGEPIANPDALMVRTICERVGMSHKVALCGQGADELLGGYPRHMAERLYRLGRLMPSLSRAVTRRAFGGESAHRLERVLATPDRAARYVEIFTVLPGNEVNALVRGASGDASDLARAAIERWLPDDRSSDTLNDLLRVDARLSLADDLLIVADHCAMRSSVELRVPFLDLAMLELVERMPSKYKVSPLGERKWLYRKAAERHLPDELARRLTPQRKRFERKRGFSTPIDVWFDTEQGPLAEHALWAKPLLTCPALSAEHVETALGAAGAAGFSRRTSVFFPLASWLESRAQASAAA
jgi:asparagine synthase (glutamine-hydrolysing)